MKEKLLMGNYDYGLHSKADEKKANNRKKLMQLWKECPIPDEHLLVNLQLFMRSSAFAKLLFLEEMYDKILEVPGKVFVFGLWWGGDLVTFENLRAIKEPYNHARRLIGFDTFEGYLEDEIGANDKKSSVINAGGYHTSEDYIKYYQELIQYHEDENIMSNIKKVDVVKGDVVKTVPEYFKKHPETITALAYFDMALYEPTKVALQYIIETCVKGSIIVFDEINDSDYPGETVALKELAKLNNIRIKRSKILPDRTYWIFE